MSIATYFTLIRQYARVHTDGVVLAYMAKMLTLGEGLAPTNLVTEIIKKVHSTCDFDQLSARAYEEISGAIMEKKTLCETLRFVTPIPDLGGHFLGIAIEKNKSLKKLTIDNPRLGRSERSSSSRSSRSGKTLTCTSTTV